MKSSLSILIIFLSSFICVNAKEQAISKPNFDSETLFEKVLNQNRKVEQMRGKKLGVLGDSVRIRDTYQNILEQLYRKPTSEELKLIAPNKEDLQEYAGFLQQSNTGLIKLINDAGCSENTKIIVASADCLKYKFPGAGSSYSFRTNSYRLPRLADLTFTDNSFQATGVHLHGIFVDIGNVPLENVNLNTRGLNTLLQFKPSTEFNQAKKVDQTLSRGVLYNGFIYRRALYAKEDTTYALRSIAYQGKSYRAVRGITYNELNFDKRRDVIIAFRIIREHPDGSVTILWKKLSDEKAPKLKRN